MMETASHRNPDSPEIECAFLNTYQARWQYTADTQRVGYAQGKTQRP